MSRTRYYNSGVEIDAEDAIDERGVVRDGVTMHVPLTMMDAMRRQVGERAAPYWEDAEADEDDERALAREIRADAYAQRAFDDENAWRNPPPRAWAGAAAEPADVADALTEDALSMMDEKERAYAEYDQWQENAWRNPGK